MQFLTFKAMPVSAGSIVMAIGIFLLGAIYQFPFLETFIGSKLSILLVVLWLLMLVSFFFSLLIRDYRKNLFDFPIQSFGAGTWIASTSVIGDLIMLRAPSYLPFVRFLLGMNLVLWIMFIALCIYQLRSIISKGNIKETHGLILLSTVSTQSVVTLWLNVTEMASQFIVGFIFIGILFYLVSITLLFIRFTSEFRDIHEWKNTDCIIHGALSITGVAMIQSGNFSFYAINFLWYIVFGLFILVETMEMVRGIKRIKAYGWKQGIFTYHISQWARNFTFGMFYFFTVNLLASHSFSPHLLGFQQRFLPILGWIVLIILIGQLLVFVYSIIKNKKVSGAS